MATGSADAAMRLWDLPAQQERAVLKGHTATVYAVAFAADGKPLATGSGEETVTLWAFETGTMRRTLRGHQSGVAASGT